MSNIEGMYCIYLIKKIARSETTLRNSIRLPFDNLRPRARRGELVAGCGSIFDILRFVFKKDPTIEMLNLIQMDVLTDGVSYERHLWPPASSLIDKETLSIHISYYRLWERFSTAINSV